MEKLTVHTREMNVEMPFRVDQLKVIPDQISGILNKAEPEIAASVLLRYSQAAGKWVGVSFDDLNFRIQVAEAEREEYDRQMNAVQEWEALSDATRVIYRLFRPRPQKPKELEDYWLGGSAKIVWIGFFYLANSGLVRIEDDFIYPTPALVAIAGEKLAQKT